MNKKILIGSILGLGMMIGPAIAFAASIDNIQFSNGQTTTQCTAGESVNVTFRVTVPVNEVMELAQVDVIGDTLAPALPTQVGGSLGLQEGQNDIQMSVTCPQNTGNYGVQLKTAGIYGGQQAVNITDGVTQSNTFGSALRVAASGNSTSGSSNIPSWLAALIAALHPTPAPAPAPAGNAAKCAMVAPFLGAGSYTYSSLGVQLQSVLLLDNPNSIPALHAGATIPMGYFGPQTHAALSAYDDKYGC